MMEDGTNKHRLCPPFLQGDGQQRDGKPGLHELKLQEAKSYKLQQGASLPKSPRGSTARSISGIRKYSHPLIFWAASFLFHGQIFPRQWDKDKPSSQSLTGISLFP